MPNWCKTNIKIEINPEGGFSKKIALQQLQDFVNKYNTGNEGKEKPNAHFLRIFYPIPESLNITAGGSVDNAMAIILSTKYGKHKPIDNILTYEWTKKEKITTRKELIDYLSAKMKSTDFEEGEKALCNLATYGQKDWYGWCNHYWGAKWDLNFNNASFKRNKKGQFTEMFISGDSPWSPPLAGIIKISEDYPALKFFVDYKEPDCGFKGNAEIDNGQCFDNCMEYDYR